MRRHQRAAPGAAAASPSAPLSALAQLPREVFSLVCSFLPPADQVCHVVRLCHRVRAMTASLQLVGAATVNAETDGRSIASAIRHLSCFKLQRLELLELSPQDAMALLLRCAPQLQQLTHLSIRSRARFHPSSVIDWRSVSLPGLLSLSICCDRRPGDPRLLSTPAVTGFESFLERHPLLASLTSDIAELWTEERLVRLLLSRSLRLWTARSIDPTLLHRAIDAAEATAATGSSSFPGPVGLLPRLTALTLELDVTRAAQQTMVANCRALFDLCQRCSDSLQRLSLGLCTSGGYSTDWTVSTAAAIPAGRLSACSRLQSLRLDGVFTHALLHRERLHGAEAWPLLQQLELSIIDATMPVQRMEAALWACTSLLDISVQVLGADCFRRAVHLLGLIGLHCPNAERVQLRACKLPAHRSSLARHRVDHSQSAAVCLQLADARAIVDSVSLPESAFRCLRSLQLRFDITTEQAAVVPPDVWLLLRQSWLAKAPLSSMMSPQLEQQDTAGGVSGSKRRWKLQLRSLLFPEQCWNAQS